MDISELRKKLSAVMEKRNLTYKEVEEGSGLPISSLRNFVNGLVKDPRLDVIVSVANFLKIDIKDLINPSPLDEVKIYGWGNEKKLSPMNNSLFLECSQGLVNYCNEKDLRLTYDESLEVISKSYDFSQKYSEGKLDTPFLKWCVDAKKY